MTKRITSDTGADGRDDRPASEAAAPKEAARIPDQQPVVFGARWARGRIGGTGTVLVFGQRARAQERDVLFLDGDLKSSSLRAFYGDAVSRPPDEDAVAFRRWALDHLDAMAEDRTSRLLDVSGGSDVLRETLQELEIPTFCDGVGFRFTWLTVLGPDREDFDHVRAAVNAGHLAPHHMLLVLNEGAIRRGQNPIGAFDPLISHPDFEALLNGGARMILLPRLTIMGECRAGRMDFYDVAAGRPNAAGEKPRPTWKFMGERWTGDIERQIVAKRVQPWLP